MSFFLKIRAHHLLCIQGYQGYGYSDKFQANLERIIQLINTAADLEIQVVAENDVICSYCPYTGQTGCQKDKDSAQNIQTMDLKILGRLGLKEGMRDNPQNLIMLTHSKFKTYFDIEEMCGDCQWKEKCLWYQKFVAGDLNIFHTDMKK